jgi:hypothetical protein
VSASTVRQRRYASCTTSSACDTRPSIPYARLRRRSRWASKRSAWVDDVNG